MTNDIFTLLRNLRHIAPDRNYVEHSKMLILASPRHAKKPDAATIRDIFSLIRISAALGAGIIGLFVILGGVSYINETYSPLALEGLNQKSMTAEANQINNSIEITLGTVDYLDASNKTALKKIAEVASSTAIITTATPTTDINAFLINNDSASTSVNDILEKVSK